MNNTPTAPAPLLVTTEQAATMLSLSPKSISRLAIAGELKPIRYGRAVRFDVRDLERWIETRKEANDE